MDTINFGPNAKNKMAAIKILKRMLSFRCEHDISSSISWKDSNFEILFYILKTTNDINIGLIS